MRHRNHRHTLGVKKEHRSALMANMAAALLTHGKIKTTLAKARALRPFTEKIITFAKKAAQTEDAARKLHYRRLAIARVRDRDAIKKLFDERAHEFLNREGGYTRIYKLIRRDSDGAEMGVIELIPASDEGYKTGRRKSAKSKAPGRKKAAEKATQSVAETEPVAENASVESETAAEEEKSS